jgi:hypothetical protein
MATNKNQHFVPQHYLRLFSVDGGKNIGITRVDPFKCVIGPISGQCQEDWFYRDDGELDDWLKVTEGAYAELLPKIISSRKLSDEDRVSCHLLAVLFHLRTKKAADIHSQFLKRIFFDVVNDGIRRGEVPPPPPNWSMDTVAVSGVSGCLVKQVLFECFLEMSTLQCKLLEPRVGMKFITSDHPAVCMNQLLAKNGEVTGRSYTGFATSGFQLVLPICPDLCLFFYDPGIYKVGSKIGNLVKLCQNDVDLINSLQVQNADKCVYSCDPDNSTAIEALVRKFKPLRKATSEALNVTEQNQKAVLYHLRSPNPQLLKPWSFCKVRRHPRIDDSLRRNAAWTDVVRSFTSHADKVKPSDLMGEFLRFIGNHDVSQPK